LQTFHASVRPERVDHPSPSPQPVLTTTLEPCLQCAAAIRLGPIANVRFAGPDLFWELAPATGRDDAS